MKRFLVFALVADYYLAAILLIWAGIGKMLSPAVSELLESLLEQDVIDIDQLVIISRWSPPLEIIFGIIVLTGIKAHITARITAVIYLFFSAIILYISQGYLLLPIDCGCFGAGEPTPVYQLLLRNTAIALPLLFFNKKYTKWTLISFFYK